MGNISKLAAIGLFQEYGLEGLPARVYPASSRPGLTELTRDFPGTPLFMLRTGSDVEERNLPRKAGVALADVPAWAAELPPRLHLVVQPYASVTYSVELAFWPNGYMAELVPGIWELSTDLQPAVVTMWQNALSLSATLAPQPAVFYLPDTGYTAMAALVADWQVVAVVNWVRHHYDRLVRLHDGLGGGGIGLKLHDAVGYGLSPQNIRANLPPFTPESIVSAPSGLAMVSSVSDSLPHADAILLDVSVAREDHAELAALIARLHQAGIGTVYLKSGLLSHLAIALREAGFTVRRYA